MDRRRLPVRRISINSGFTIVELIVTVTVAAILAGILFGPLDDLYQSNVKSLTKVVQTTDTRSALRSIQENIALSSEFLAQNTVADPAGTEWNATNGSGVNNVLITSNNATTIDASLDTSNTRLLVTDLGCNNPVKNNYVYFVSDGTLYRRLIKNTSTATCNSMTIGQKQTCAAGYGSQPYKDSCQGVDATILTRVTSFTIDYYALPADSTTISDPTAATTVVLKVTSERGNGNNKTSFNTSLRISRVNN